MLVHSRSPSFTLVRARPRSVALVCARAHPFAPVHARLRPSAPGPARQRSSPKAVSRALTDGERPLSVSSSCLSLMPRRQGRSDAVAKQSARARDAIRSSRGSQRETAPGSNEQRRAMISRSRLFVSGDEVDDNDDGGTCPRVTQIGRLTMNSPADRA